MSSLAELSLNWIEFGLFWEKNAQAQYLGSILRLNVQAQYSGSISNFFCAKKIAQAQCSSSMFRLNVPDLSGIL